MVAISRKCTFGLFFFLSLQTLEAGDLHLTYEINDLAKVQSEVESSLTSLPPEKIAVIWDLDNTLLTQNQYLGSVPWFDWQAELLKAKDSKSKDLVGNDFNGLLRVQGVLFGLSGMLPSQDDVASILESVSGKKVFQAVLTARGSEFRDATLREMSRNGLSLEGGLGKFLPFERGKEIKIGVSKNEMKHLPDKDPKLVTYQDGILMVSGQHKGLMLRSLLSHLGRSVSKVIFADDSAKNCMEMHQGFLDTPINVTAFRYGKLDSAVAAFDAKEKRKATRDWVQIKKLMYQVLKTPTAIEGANEIISAPLQKEVAR